MFRYVPNCPAATAKIWNCVYNVLYNEGRNDAALYKEYYDRILEDISSSIGRAGNMRAAYDEGYEIWRIS